MGGGEGEGKLWGDPLLSHTPSPSPPLDAAHRFFRDFLFKKGYWSVELVSTLIPDQVFKKLRGVHTRGAVGTPTEISLPWPAGTYGNTTYGRLHVVNFSKKKRKKTESIKTTTKSKKKMHGCQVQLG